MALVLRLSCVTLLLLVLPLSARSDETVTSSSPDSVLRAKHQYGWPYSLSPLWNHGVFPNSNCTCDTHPDVTSWFGLEVCSAPLIPSWLLAVVIGLSSGWKFYSLGSSVTGSLSYAISFAMFAMMITSGLFVHCIFLVECGKAPVTQAYINVAKIDGSLTSSVAISFLFNGLIDLKLIPERAFGTVMCMVCTYVWVFFAYFAELFPGMNLYFGTIVVGCSLYLLCQLVCLFTSHCKAISYLMLAGLAGGGSLWLFYAHSCWLCWTLGAWSIEGVWYYWSDLSMLFIFYYAWHTRVRYVPVSSPDALLQGDEPRRHSLESESGTYTDDEVFGSEKEEPHIFVA